MLTAIKKSMRITHSQLDDDIQREIDACKKDLERVGVVLLLNEARPLVTTACELWCKANYDYLGKGAEFRERYIDLRNALSLSTEYNSEAAINV